MANRVWVLGGGGAKGAFQLGAMEVLHESGLSPSKVIGSSVGAINGAVWSTGQREELRDVWMNLSEDQVMTGGPGPGRFIGLGLGWKRSIYDLDPLRELLSEYLEGREPEIPFRAGVVDLATGAFGYNLLDSLVDNVWASATMPVIWEPVEGRYVDGGLRNIAPLKEAMDDDPDEIIVVLCSPLDVEVEDVRDNQIWDDAQRTLNVITNEVYRNDVKSFLLINHLLAQADRPLFNRAGQELRHVPVTVIAPQEAMGDTLDFSQETARRLLAEGRKRALDVLGDL